MIKDERAEACAAACLRVWQLKDRRKPWSSEISVRVGVRVLNWKKYVGGGRNAKIYIYLAIWWDQICFYKIVFIYSKALMKTVEPSNRNLPAQTAQLTWTLNSVPVIGHDDAGIETPTMRPFVVAEELLLAAPSSSVSPCEFYTRPTRCVKWAGSEKMAGAKIG